MPRVSTVASLKLVITRFFCFFPFDYFDLIARGDSSIKPRFMDCFREKKKDGAAIKSKLDKRSWAVCYSFNAFYRSAMYRHVFSTSLHLMNFSIYIITYSLNVWNKKCFVATKKPRYDEGAVRV